MTARDRLRAGFERLPRPGRRIIDVVVATYAAWRGDRTIRLGAGLAYYGLFSLASVLTLTVWLVQLLSRRGDIEAYVADAIEQLVGTAAPDLAATVATEIEGSTGTQLGLVGLGTLLVSGSLFFLALEDAFNQIYGVPVGSGFRWTVRRRLTSVVVLLGAAATIMLSAAVQAVSGLTEWLLPGATTTASAIGTLLASGLSTAVLTGALVLLFRYLPAVEVGWRAAIISAGVTSALLIVGTTLIGWYLRRFGATSLSGAASSVVAVLFWIFYEAQIVLAGVQLCKVISFGSRPAETTPPVAP